MKLTITSILFLTIFLTVVNAQSNNKLTTQSQNDTISFNENHEEKNNSLPSTSTPIPVEGLVGSRGIFLTSMTKKQFNSVPKLGYFSVFSLVKEWETSKLNDLMIQAHLTYKITKGLTVIGGFHYTTMTNFRPTAGVMYNYGNKDFTVVLFPRIDLASKPNTEIFGFIEYRPQISETLRFYSKIQAMYVHNLSSGQHQKSGFNLRAGLMYKEFAFGAGLNSDYYSPAKINETNVGLFVNILIF